MLHTFLKALVLMLLMSMAQAQSPATPRPFKIVHVMSYHSPWVWTDGQLEGFKRSLAGIPLEVKVFQMNTKVNSDLKSKEKLGSEARALIDSWKPDLLYTTDDEAQEFVASHYVGSNLPIVFSGVNAAPAKYGFSDAKNVTGVLEQEHFIESLTLLRSIVPGVKRVAVVFDDAAIWQPVAARMRESASRQSEFNVVAWDTIRTWEEYKAKVLAYQSSADAIALIGVFNFKDERQKNVPYQEVLKWTAANSRLPDISFWRDRVAHGTLASMTVSEKEQGLAAGLLAKAILVDKKEPSSLPMRPTVKGVPIISHARADSLGIKMRSTTYLSSEILPDFEWNKAAK